MVIILAQEGSMKPLNRSQMPSTQQQSAVMERLLNTTVSVRNTTQSWEQNFHNFESPAVGIISASGDPVRIANGRSHSSQIFIYKNLLGTSVLDYQSGSVALAKDEFVVFRGSHALEVIHERRYSIIGLRMCETAVSRLLPSWEEAAFVKIPDSGVGETGLLFRMAEDLLHTGSSLQARSAFAVSEAMVSIVAQCLSTVVNDDLCDSYTQAQVHLKRIKRYCQQKLSVPNLSVASISQALGISIAHIYRLYAQESCTPMAWIQAQRLNASRTVIEQSRGDCRLTDVALACGFKESAHFSHAFRSRFGQSPSEFRAQSRVRLDQ
jgi:AraC-like DNA-binding protein